MAKTAEEKAQRKRETRRRHYRDNKLKYQEYHRLKYQQNADHNRQQKKDYYEKNKTMILEKNRMKRKQLKDRLEELEQQVLQQWNHFFTRVIIFNILVKISPTPQKRSLKK